MLVTDQDTELRRLAAELQAAQQARDDARDRLKDAVTQALRSGMTERHAATLAGVNRNTLRIWQGKQDHQNRPIRGTQEVSTHSPQDAGTHEPRQDTGSA